MTASSKKKKEKKQKDFAKPKLKVGKAKSKPSNFTETSFKAKAIVLASQSLHQVTPTQIHQLKHHVSLLTHHSSTTRRESLAYLTTHLPSTFTSSTYSAAEGAQSTIPASALIPTLSPMILDTSASVRAQLLLLMQILPKSYVEIYVSKIMLYITSAMTHISPDIRGDSTKFLAWLLSVNKDSLLRNGGWSKGLRGLIGVLGWGAAKDNVTVEGTRNAGTKGKLILQHLGVLEEFLQAGLLGSQREVCSTDFSDDNSWKIFVPHWTTHLHMLPSNPWQSNAFSYLGLFSGTQSNNGGGDGVEDVEARRRWLLEGLGRDALQSLRKGIDITRKEGGEIGRLGGKIYITLENGLRVELNDNQRF
ncbi:Rix1 complex component [Kalaharituber pfeilii]|nr:Rix1 complex component [Kalaharituber pfeilii]